jgi:hypothetical protein
MSNWWVSILGGESGRDQFTASAEPLLAVSNDLFVHVAFGEAMNGPADAVNWSLHWPSASLSTLKDGESCSSSMSGYLATISEGQPGVAGQESGHQQRRAPDEFCSQYEPAAHKGVGSRAGALADLPLFLDERQVLALAGLQAGEGEPPDLLSGKQFVVRHAQTGSEVAPGVAKPFKCVVHHDQSLHR